MEPERGATHELELRVNHPRWSVTLADQAQTGYEDKGTFDDEQAALDWAADIVEDYNKSPVWTVRHKSDTSYEESWTMTSLDMTLVLTVEEVD